MKYQVKTFHFLQTAVTMYNLLKIKNLFPVFVLIVYSENVQYLPAILNVK